MKPMSDKSACFYSLPPEVLLNILSKSTDMKQYRSMRMVSPFARAVESDLRIAYDTETSLSNAKPVYDLLTHVPLSKDDVEHSIKKKLGIMAEVHSIVSKHDNLQSLSEFAHGTSATPLIRALVCAVQYYNLSVIDAKSWSKIWTKLWHEDDSVVKFFIIRQNHLFHIQTYFNKFRSDWYDSINLNWTQAGSIKHVVIFHIIIQKIRESCDALLLIDHTKLTYVSDSKQFDLYVDCRKHVSELFWFFVNSIWNFIVYKDKRWSLCDLTSNQTQELTYYLSEYIDTKVLSFVLSTSLFMNTNLFKRSQLYESIISRNSAAQLLIKLSFMLNTLSIYLYKELERQVLMITSDYSSLNELVVHLNFVFENYIHTKLN